MVSWGGPPQEAVGGSGGAKPPQEYRPFTCVDKKKVFQQLVVDSITGTPLLQLVYLELD